MYSVIRLVNYVNLKYSKLVFIPLTIVLFALADYLVAWLVALFWIGPQGSIDSVLPIGSTALVLADSPFRFASRFIGFYGLAAFVWVTVYLLYSKQTRKYAVIPIAVLSIVSLSGWILYKSPNGSQVRVTIVSEKLDDRVPQVNPRSADLVLFPEYGLEKNDNSNLQERIMRTTVDQPKTYFAGSDQVYKNDVTGHKNNMKFGNTLDGFTDSQEKYRLIPGGEDLPYLMRTLLRATNQKSTLDYFSYAKGVLKGPYQLKPFVLSSDTHVATAVCSSIIAPEDYREFTNSGATIFTNSASLTTFKGSPLFKWQQKSLAKFMATANSRYFIQSANSATAYALDNNGNQIAEVGGVNTVTVKAVNNSRITPYVVLGEWLVKAGAIVAVFVLLSSTRAKKFYKKYLIKFHKKRH